MSPLSPARTARTASPTDAPVFGQLTRIAQHLQHLNMQQALLRARGSPSEELRLVEQELACLQAGIAQARRGNGFAPSAAGETRFVVGALPGSPF